MPESRRFGSLATAAALAAVACAAAWADARRAWIPRAFDFVAHQFYEVPVLAAIRRPSQLALVRAHAAILAALLVATLATRPWSSTHTRRLIAIFLVAYTTRAVIWIIGGNLPLVPGDSSHYIEVASSIARGEGPVKHYVESYFRDYPSIAQGRGALDDWATPLYSYVLAGCCRALGVDPLAAPLETTTAIAKAASFAFSLLALPILYLCARRTHGRDVATLATALLAVLPVHALYAGFALRESLVACTTLLAVWTLVELHAARRRAAYAWAAAAGIAFGLAILARNTALAIAAGCALDALLRLISGRARLAPLLLVAVVAAAVVAPWAAATTLEYGTPFYTYTSYFQYNFSWTIHHYDRGITRAADFYTRANAPEIARVKLKSLLIILVYVPMILSVPLAGAIVARLRRRTDRGAATDVEARDYDRLVAILGAVFVAATLAQIADVTQVAQLGRYYLPWFCLALPTAAAGLIDLARGWSLPTAARRAAACGIVALLWADPTWAYDYTWLAKPHQLRWPALVDAGDWIKQHPDAVPRDARILTWLPWELRIASDRATILLPRSYQYDRIRHVIEQYRVTHVLWGSFDDPPHAEPEAWGRYLSALRVELGLTDDRELHRSPPRLAYPVHLYRIR